MTKRCFRITALLKTGKRSQSSRLVGHHSLPPFANATPRCAHFIITTINRDPLRTEPCRSDLPKRFGAFISYTTQAVFNNPEPPPPLATPPPPWCNPPAPHSSPVFCCAVPSTALIAYFGRARISHRSGIFVPMYNSAWPSPIEGLFRPLARGRRNVPLTPPVLKACSRRRPTCFRARRSARRHAARYGSTSYVRRLTSSASIVPRISDVAFSVYAEGLAVGPEVR